MGSVVYCVAFGSDSDSCSAIANDAYKTTIDTSDTSFNISTFGLTYSASETYAVALSDSTTNCTYLSSVNTIVCE